MNVAAILIGNFIGSLIYQIFTDKKPNKEINTWKNRFGIASAVVVFMAILTGIALFIIFIVNLFVGGR